MIGGEVHRAPPLPMLRSCLDQLQPPDWAPCAAVPVAPPPPPPADVAAAVVAACVRRSVVLSWRTDAQAVSDAAGTSFPAADAAFAALRRRLRGLLIRVHLPAQSAEYRLLHVTDVGLHTRPYDCPPKQPGPAGTETIGSGWRAAPGATASGVCTAWWTSPTRISPRPPRWLSTAPPTSRLASRWTWGGCTCWPQTRRSRCSHRPKCDAPAPAHGGGIHDDETRACVRALSVSEARNSSAEIGKRARSSSFHFRRTGSCLMAAEVDGGGAETPQEPPSPEMRLRMRLPRPRSCSEDPWSAVTGWLTRACERVRALQMCPGCRCARCVWRLCNCALPRTLKLRSLARATPRSARCAASVPRWRRA